MIDPSTGGGIAGGVAAIAYATKLFVEARKEARATGTNGTSAAVSDAAAANSLLLAALQEERGEVQRLSDRVDALQKENGDLYAQMQRQRRDYDAELQAMREQLAGLTTQLEALQARIRAGGS